MRTNESLSQYDRMPEEMINYFAFNGKHFNKKMYEFAVSKMYKANNSKVETISKEELENKLKKYGVSIKYNVMYDANYVYSMAKADFYGSSIVDEMHLLLFIKDYIDDPDAVDGFVFNRFYADCCLKGIPIDWSDML